MMVLGEFYAFCEKIPQAQKAQDVKQATFFMMFLCTESTKSDFFHLRRFYAHKKHKKHKTSSASSSQTFYAHKNAVSFICLCMLCAFCAKETTFFLVDVFYARLKLSLFLFAYVHFVLFALVGSFHKRYKTPPIAPSTILLTQMPKSN